MEMGDVAEGKRLFQSVPMDPEDGDAVMGLAYAGDFAGASAALHAALAKYPHGTQWNLYWAPLTEAVIAMAKNNPKEAAALLEPPSPCERHDLGYRGLRGDAFLAAGRMKDAERVYRDVLAHPELDPTSGNLPFAWLGLGRAYAAEGNRAAAADAYQHFFTLWAHADPDAMYLQQAKQEFAKLSPSGNLS